MNFFAEFSHQFFVFKAQPKIAVKIKVKTDSELEQLKMKGRQCSVLALEETPSEGIEPCPRGHPKSNEKC